NLSRVPMTSARTSPQLRMIPKPMLAAASTRSRSMTTLTTTTTTTTSPCFFPPRLPLRNRRSCPLRHFKYCQHHHPTQRSLSLRKSHKQNRLMTRQELAKGDIATGTRPCLTSSVTTGELAARPATIAK
ncbi:hypothetical protein BGZ93_004370, partial [Podila epicladia]